MKKKYFLVLFVLILFSSCNINDFLSQVESERNSNKNQHSLKVDFKIFELVFYDTSDSIINKDEDIIIIGAFLSEGSDKVKLDDLRIILGHTNKDTIYSYVPGKTSLNSFNITYEKGPGMPNYISKHDVVRLTINSPLDINSGDNIEIQIFEVLQTENEIHKYLIPLEKMEEKYTILK